MAINPNTQYPGKVAAPDANYPYGGAQNITAPGDGTGTPWEKALLNDIFGLQQSLLKSAGIVPSGAADKVGASQYLQAIVEIASGRARAYDDVGAANAYVLNVKSNQEGPQGYYDGMVVTFVANAGNTGASTIDVNGLGVKTIKVKTGGTVVNAVLNDIKIAHIQRMQYSTSFGGVFILFKDRMSIFNISTVIGAGTSSVSNLAHQLGTDDFQFTASLFGSINPLVSCEIYRPDGAFSVFGNTPLIVPDGAAAVANTIRVKVHNHHTSSQTVNVKITAFPRLQD